MPTLLTSRGPVQIREYAADRAAQGASDRELVERVRVHERGPEILVEPYVHAIRVGHLIMPRDAELAIVERLFGEVRELRTDRAAFQAVLQTFEDAILSKDTERVIHAWRSVMGVFDTMARDVASLAALPEQGRGAA